MQRAVFPSLRWPLPLLAVLSIGLVAACPSAPLAGKECPCILPDACCHGVCIAAGADCPCSSLTLTSPVITTGGTEVEPDGGTDGGTVLSIDGGKEIQLVFGQEPEQWVSYPFKGTEEMRSRAELTEDGKGFHVQAPLSHMGGSGKLYVGFGLSFRSQKCVDGAAYTGLQFDLAGSMLGSGLSVGATSPGGVSKADDPDRGTCDQDPTTPVCYGPSKSIPMAAGTTRVPFDLMTGGQQLVREKIVNVQWQINDGADVTDSDADFTVKNVTFY
jgi:hypothetical protein